MIVVGFGVALIAILVFCKVLSLVQPKLKNSQAFVYLINYSIMDRVRTRHIVDTSNRAVYRVRALWDQLA